ncbi:MAG: class I SAM-dependent methyltransferase [Candidatus Zixiibacteriota bacterium]|nr:MAG: class I SAM-dependent methyltransferase [candidate division Zixibacteria bacterium]
MTKTRIEYPGTLINERDPEKHFHFQDTGMREYYDEVIKRIPGLRSFEGKALHVGCGTAAFENLLCDRLEFARFYGLELSPTLVRIGEAISSRFKYADRISLKVWEDELLPFPDNEFDLVISLSSMHQWKNPEKTLKEIDRVVKKEGAVFISDFRREQFYLPFYFFARKIGSLYGDEIGQNLLAAYKASFTTSQIRELLEAQHLDGWETKKEGKWFYVTSPIPQGNNSESAGVVEKEKGGG